MVRRGRRAAAPSRARALARGLARQLAGVGVLDNATRLAAQAFLTALPLLIAIAAYSPDALRAELIASLRSLFGVTGPLMSQVDQVYRGGPGARQTWGALGVLVAVVSATGFVRALQRLCERSWHLPRAGVRIAVWRWFVWLAVWLAVLVCQGRLHGGFGAAPASGVALQVVVAVLMWWWTPHLLLAGRIGWRPLFPGALVTGGAVVAFTGLSGFWLPHSLAASVQRYGPLGSVFTVLSWLILFFATVVLAVSVGYVLARDRLADFRPDGPDTPATAPRSTGRPGRGEHRRDGRRTVRRPFLTRRR
ncbi:ribonuclease BN [Streptomyces sp. Ru73]|uniref:YhjD/YihY/BrkB family envelope integrity protein n=1 Tax=Streptomyces sp. Ru73 TaxID=2080748 RepID=UPI000CDE0215|nr:YhjD/YihY/BrkB family envelope integrity protein [Streptomyces sp. Ru73]POX37329.1 ribonuclease BN [Streptomyces sp. Ru73]